MISPKKHLSKARTRSRRANWKLTPPNVVSCPQCREPKLYHQLCKHCGYYDKRQVVDTTAKAK